VARYQPAQLSSAQRTAISTYSTAPLPETQRTQTTSTQQGFDGFDEGFEDDGADLMTSSEQDDLEESQDLANEETMLEAVEADDSMFAEEANTDDASFEDASFDVDEAFSEDDFEDMGEDFDF
jgi:hypothetical protein